MGCDFCPGVGVDPEIAKILASLDTKVEEFEEIFQKDANKVKEDKEKVLKERHEKLEELKKKNEEITEELIKNLNKNELKVEIDILSNEVNKMHYIFDIGLELVEPVKKYSLDKLLSKAKTAPSFTLDRINKQIDEIKKMPSIEFLDSTYGKVLKDALAKKGMSETLLKSFKNELFKERQERRKNERKEFGIKVNEFDDEKIDAIKLDLFDLIKEEYKDINKHYRDYCRDKMVEAWCEVNNAMAADYKK